MAGLRDFLDNASQTIQGTTNTAQGWTGGNQIAGAVNAALGKATGDPRSLADLYAAGVQHERNKNATFAQQNPTAATVGNAAGAIGATAMLPNLAQTLNIAKALGGAAWNVGKRIAMPAAQAGTVFALGNGFGGAPVQSAGMPPPSSAGAPTSSPAALAAGPVVAPASASALDRLPKFSTSMNAPAVSAAASVEPHVAALAAVPHAAQDLHPSTHTAMDFVNANRHLTYYDLQQMEASLPKPLSDPTALARQTVMDLLGQSTQNKLQTLDKSTKDQATPAYATAKSKILDDHLEMLKKHILVPGSLNPYIAQAMEAQQQ